jgi:hypothetical protein
MSATPRPWVKDVDAEDAVMLYRQEGRHLTLPVATVHTGEDTADLILHSVNAFDALLAVAKAVPAPDRVLDDDFNMNDLHQLAEAMAALDGAHPGWREWK